MKYTSILLFAGALLVICAFGWYLIFHEVQTILVCDTSAKICVEFPKEKIDRNENDGCWFLRESTDLRKEFCAPDYKVYEEQNIMSELSQGCREKFGGELSGLTSGDLYLCSKQGTVLYYYDLTESGWHPFTGN